jgi:multimeric flavodoxin WrbA
VTEQPDSGADVWRFDGLRALYVNCTLKRSPEPSHTQGLIDVSRSIMQRHGVAVSVLRAADHDIATGVWPDMTEHGWPSDAWPAIYQQVLAADILVLCGPIWLGDNSSVMKRVIERLYACSSLLNEAGQYAYYGRVAGCLLTGNEDGAKHCAMNILYSLQHLGYTIPPIPLDRLGDPPIRPQNDVPGPPHRRLQRPRLVGGPRCLLRPRRRPPCRSRSWSWRSCHRGR